MIPDEAVEAAAKALRTAPLHGVASWRDIAQTALEAAAPHMLAGMFTAEEVARAFGVKEYPRPTP